MELKEATVNKVSVTKAADIVEIRKENPMKLSTLPPAVLKVFLNISAYTEYMQEITANPHKNHAELKNSPIAVDFPVVGLGASLKNCD